jgi:4-hydroxy-tetrahydrodipicolinate reductase
MEHKLRVIQYGLGPIGAATARLINERSGLELIAGVDIDPEKEGKDVGLVIGLDKPLGIKVVKSINDLDGQLNADIVMHTTNSFFSDFKPQIISILEAGFNVVSTSEELSFPWFANKEDAVEIDIVAKKVEKTVLGTGVNPGFLMDSLPIMLTSICQRVDHIHVTRVINASTRRGPFQKKIGAGLSVEEFNSLIALGKMGHIGLRQSSGMVLNAFGKKLLKFETSVEPIVAKQRIETKYVVAEIGQVIGIKQSAAGSSESGEFIKLNFSAALDAQDEHDTIAISGKPDLNIRLQGTNGDLATVAIAVNSIPRVFAADPGLATMRDLPLISCW